MRHITIKISKAVNGYIIEDKTGTGVETHIAESQGKVEEVLKNLLAKLDSGCAISGSVTGKKYSYKGPACRSSDDNEDWE